jgi:hypothetical protein
MTMGRNSLEVEQLRLPLEVLPKEAAASVSPMMQRLLNLHASWAEVVSVKGMKLTHKMPLRAGRQENIRQGYLRPFLRNCERVTSHA